MKKLFTVALSAVLFLSACNKNSTNTSLNKLEKEPEVIKEIYYAPLSGTVVDEPINTEPIFAVMLNNHPKSLPQASLNEAEIVYEFKVEGTYTRFMALYQKNHPSIIGSVRSARPYFVNTASEYNAIYSHWGGSDAGYAQISKLNLKDLDGIYLEGSTYYRNKQVKKKAPHNGYTSYDLLYQAAGDKNFLDGYYHEDAFNFDTTSDLEKVKAQMKDRIATKLSLDFFHDYNMTFNYDDVNDCYYLVRNGEDVIDENDGSNVFCKNIIVEFATSHVTGPKETLTIDHIGEGSGLLFTNGKFIDIKWSKDSETSKTIFKTLDDEDIVLSPGRTFIEVLDPNDNVIIEPIVENQQTQETQNTPDNKN